jgi:dual specificity tyrosine-phosphorylation-regulated kinase 2/3/4
VLAIIGKGSFGQVFKAFDHKIKELVALKVIKNKPKYTAQAQVETRLLRYIAAEDTDKSSNIIEVKDSIMFRGHVVNTNDIQCLTFELLHQNLYEFIKQNKFSGFSIDLIRRFSIQILKALMFLNKHKIIHCDMKPENLLLKQENKSGIKVIDLGSSCKTNEIMYTYIQSRFYRAPEIILGVEYTSAIDMWSFGCILCELYTGHPIFPGQD